MNSYLLTIRCPYCGNLIRIYQSTPHFSLGVGSRYISGHITLGGIPKTFSSYRVRCDFCKRKYKYFDFGGDYSFFKYEGFVRFTKQAIEWFAINDIDLEKLPSMIIGVIEPEDDPFTTFKKRLKKKISKIKGKLRTPVSHRFIRVVIEVRKGKHTRKAVLHGRIYEGDKGEGIKYITFEHVTWLYPQMLFRSG